MRPTALFFAIALLSAVASPAAACRNVRMKNDTGQTVNDLHFETNQGNQDVSFADLADGQRVIVTLRGPTSPECQNIKILKWWWTKDSVMVGLKKDGEPEARFSVNGGPAAGSGQIRIRVNGIDLFFSPTPGDFPSQTLGKFQSFLNGITDLGYPEISV